ncbi:hypothetical protein NPIL_260181 [Nephila pilipes]|uniref:Uncharacterized protein n=1 Tax=Nephila pilipes TaxID=299642 RepID=A0A8X6MEI8_NEPPI|nr:hypothetical protein NPIL_260181 [Nephila pilipes]
MISVFFSLFLIYLHEITTVESVDCEVLCKKSGAPRIGNCFCKMIIFGQKRLFESDPYEPSSGRGASCRELCLRTGASRIGNCYCRSELFQEKKSHDSTLDLEKRDISCQQLCSQSGANRIGNCYCRPDLFQQKRNIEEYNDFSVNA